MKKYFFVLLMFFISTTSSANSKSFIKQAWLLDGMIGVAHFNHLIDAKNGAVGSEFRQIPEFLLAPNSATTPTDDSEALCIVNDEGKAIDKNGDFMGMCEMSDEVAIRTRNYVLRWHDDE